MNIDLKTTVIFYNIMSFVISSRNNVEGDLLQQKEDNINLLDQFISLFGNLSNASKGQTIKYDGTKWAPSSEKKNVFINYYGDIGHEICNIYVISRDSYEYILKIKGYIKDKNDLTNSRVDLSYIVTENSVNRFGLNTGLFLINFRLTDKRLFLSLVESSIYSLEFFINPFYGNIDDLSIEFDTSDQKKYYYIN